MWVRVPLNPPREKENCPGKPRGSRQVSSRKNIRLGKKTQMVCVGCGESPGVPLHPFESGSPICGWCLRLSRQRDDVRSSRTASIYGRAGYEYPPSVGRMLKWGFESPTAPKKIKKGLDKPPKVWYNQDVSKGGALSHKGAVCELAERVCV